MTRYRVRSGQLSYALVTLGEGDTLIVEEGARHGGRYGVATLTAGDIDILNRGWIYNHRPDVTLISGTVAERIDGVIRNEGRITSGNVVIGITAQAGGDLRLINSGQIETDESVSVAKLNGFDSVRIENSGSVRHIGYFAAFDVGLVAGGKVNFDNTGDIFSFGTLADARGAVTIMAEEGDGRAWITNSGSIECKNGTVTANFAVHLTNLQGGSIHARSGTAIRLTAEGGSSFDTAFITNSGSITAARTYFDGLVGDAIDIDYVIRLENNSRIRASDGYGEDESVAVQARGGVIENRGRILGEEVAIVMDDGQGGSALVATRIRNFNEISTDGDTAIRLVGDFADTIVNRGVISGKGAFTIEAGGGDDRMLNLGRIVGGVMLGDGNDLYDGTAATQVGAIHGGDGDDVLRGSAHAETFVGGAGRDIMTGGSGPDTFVFLALDDSGSTVTTADRILNYTVSDAIDLSAIDPVPATPENEVFGYLDNTAFTGTAGELQVRTESERTVLTADVNGDRVGDFVIVLEGYTGPPAALPLIL